MGHLVKLQPLALELARRGHRVFLALRDLSRAKHLFPADDLTFLQAPYKNDARHAIEPAFTFAQILHNSGFGDPDELAALVGAWQFIYRHVAPDLIVFDHSPMAMLAAQTCRARKLLLCTGFACPVDEAPLRNLRPWMNPDAGQLRTDEARVLANMNHVLATFSGLLLDRVSQLFHRVDSTFLATLPELDHYPDRVNGNYVGIWPAVECTAKRPEWPSSSGKRIFAYLKPFVALPDLLRLFGNLPHSILVHGDGLNRQVCARFQAPNMRFEEQPLNLAQVREDCDLAILNGGHSSTVEMLLARKPVFVIPLYLEQTLTGHAVAKLGAGICESPKNAQQFATQLQSMLADDGYRQAAASFAAKYRDVDRTCKLHALIDHAETLATRR
jgi:UDP:flavonoid glycosyltransferase YjiC (YdhE family)